MEMNLMVIHCIYFEYFPNPQVYLSGSEKFGVTPHQVHFSFILHSSIHRRCMWYVWYNVKESLLKNVVIIFCPQARNMKPSIMSKEKGWYSEYLEGLDKATCAWAYSHLPLHNGKVYEFLKAHICNHPWKHSRSCVNYLTEGQINTKESQVWWNEESHSKITCLIMDA